MMDVHGINRIVFDTTGRDHIEMINKIKTITEVSKGDDKENLTSDTEIKNIVKEANGLVLGLNVNFQVLTHEGTNRTIVQMKDSITDEVIKEYPPSEMLDVIAGIWEQAGIIIDRTE